MRAAMLRKAAALLAPALLAAPGLAAQTVAGELVERGSGAPLRGALVALLDESGVQRASALTSASGGFTLRAPAAGRWRVRAERVGFASAASPVLELAVDQTATVRLEAAPEAIQLEAVAARGRRRGCRVRPAEGEATATLWEEARKALNAAAFVESGGLLRYDLSLYQRELDPATLRVLTEQRQQGVSGARSAFVSAPAEELARQGYIRPASGGTVFYAPDAAVLLSDVFLDGHCFRVAEENAPEPGLVGLAFEPVGGRLPDVAGVLWLDPRTAELRLLEYRYTRVPADVDAERLGGRVEFGRLETGEWYVRRWRIRMPTVARFETPYRMRGSTFSGSREPDARSVLALREEGGEVVRAGARGAPAAASGRVAGTVFDSLAARPLAGARVFLSGTQYAAVTDSAGAFAIDGVPTGSYAVSFTHPGLDALALAPPAATATVRAGAADSVSLATPSLATVVGALCAGRPPAPGTGVVVGRVRGGDGRPAGGARVTLEWRQANARMTAMTSLSAETRADADGHYHLCGVPTALALRARASAGAEAARFTLRPRGEAALRQDFNLVAGSAAEAPESRGSALALAEAPGPRPVSLAPTDARRRPGSSERGARGGYVIGRDEIERRRPRDILELLRSVPGAVLVPAPGGGFDLSFAGRIVGREPTQALPPPPGAQPGEAAPSAAPRCDASQRQTEAARDAGCGPPRDAGPRDDRGVCPVRYYVDGQPLTLPPGSALTTEVRPAEVERIQVFTRAAEVPAEYARPGSECGVVLVWTRARSR